MSAQETSTLKHAEVEQTQDQEPVLLKEREVAKLLKVSPRTLQSWRLKGYGPPYRQISSRCIRYDQDDVSRYLASTKRRSTSDPGPGGK
jgi:predicted DNA-binding transcriptional regulator AlpA